MADISDPTDFAPPSLPPSISTTISEPLSSIDAVLRCHVCKDFFTNPVITTCCHTFCSLCVRRCLSVDGQCPYCRAQEQVTKLRPNWVVEEMVERWTSGRKGIIEGLNTLGVKESTTVPVNGTEDARRQSKRQKLNKDTETVSDVSAGRTTRARTRRANMSSQEDATNNLPPSQEVEMVEDSEAGSSYENESSSKSPPTEKPSIRDNRPDLLEEAGLVPCPVCSVRMKEDAVFAHLDHCTGEPPRLPPQPPLTRPSARPKSNSPFVTSSASAPTPLQPLPTINYSLLNESKLKRKLKELGIPDWGPKLLLQRRHTEWVNLWNANCDARRPKSKRDLLQELDVWERTLGGHAPPPTTGGQTTSNTILSSAGGGNGGGGIAEKDFKTDEWNRTHQNDFKELIRQAREKRQSAKPSTTATATTTPTSNPPASSPSSLPPPTAAPAPYPQTVVHIPPAVNGGNTALPPSSLFPQQQHQQPYDEDPDLVVLNGPSPALVPHASSAGAHPTWRQG